MKKKQLPRTVAWNGVVLKTPSDFEIESLDKTHLILGNNGISALEIKWTDSPGRFTLETYLKGFIARSQKLLNIKIYEQPHPRGFSHPNPDFDFFFFTWESNTSKGQGTLIFCTRCKRLTMIRFFSNQEIKEHTLPGRIISSFVDHPQQNSVKWDVFGLKFSTPDRFTLDEYFFKPGSFMIRLKDRAVAYTVFSWGPASFLLSKSSLSEFAKEQLPEIEGLSTVSDTVNAVCQEWAFKKEKFKGASFIPGLNRLSRFSLFRICHHTDLNRILGVMIESPEKFERQLIEDSIISHV